MKSITIHGIDGQMDSLLRVRAANEGLSLNKMVKKILGQALGIQLPDEKQRADDFREFLGSWTEDEYHSVQDSLKDFDDIDEDEWS